MSDAGLGLLDLSFHHVERVVYRLLEGAGLLLYAQVAAGYAERDYCDLVPFFIVLVELQDDVRTNFFSMNSMSCLPASNFTD